MMVQCWTQAWIHQVDDGATELVAAFVRTVLIDSSSATSIQHSFSTVNVSWYLSWNGDAIRTIDAYIDWSYRSSDVSFTGNTLPPCSVSLSQINVLNVTSISEMWSIFRICCACCPFILSTTELSIDDTFDARLESYQSMIHLMHDGTLSCNLYILSNADLCYYQ